LGAVAVDSHWPLQARPDLIKTHLVSPFMFTIPNQAIKHHRKPRSCRDVTKSAPSNTIWRQTPPTPIPTHAVPLPLPTTATQPQLTILKVWRSGKRRGELLKPANFKGWLHIWLQFVHKSKPCCGSRCTMRISSSTVFIAGFSRIRDTDDTPKAVMVYSSLALY
jgi:hypothetical protein